MPTATFWDYKSNPIIIGTYVNKYPHFGKFKKPAYVLQVGNQVIHIWGMALIVKQFAQQDIKFLSNIKIVYKGKIPHNTNPRFEVCDFSVEVIGQIAKPLKKKRSINY